MKIFETEILNAKPILSIPSINAIVISDLHLGFEIVKAEEEGLFLPRIQYEKIMRALEDVNGEILIINGDIKHEFSETSYHEYKEVYDFLLEAKKKFGKIFLVKGNHDTFISRITKKHRIDLYEKLKIGKFLFMHGHEKINDNNMTKIFSDGDLEYLILGHEHPCISLKADFGFEKMKCFLYGEYLKKKIIVVPALSHFALGNEINFVEREGLLSPILQKCDIDSFRAIGIVDEELFPFPAIGKIKELYTKQ